MITLLVVFTTYSLTDLIIHENVWGSVLCKTKVKFLFLCLLLGFSFWFFYYLQLYKVFRSEGLLLIWRTLFRVYEPWWWRSILLMHNRILLLNNFSGWLLERIEVRVIEHHIRCCVICWIDIAVDVWTSLCGFLLAFEHLWSLNFPNLLCCAAIAIEALYGRTDCIASGSVNHLIIIFSDQLNYFGWTTLRSVRISACIGSHTVCSCVDYLLLNNLDIWLDTSWTIFFPINCLHV